MRVVCYHMYQVFKPTILNSHSLRLMESQSKSIAKPQSLRQAPVHCDAISKLPVITSRCKSTCDQQNAGDGNMQGSPFGRFTRPCGFPSPAIYFLPAERDYRDISDFFAFKGETIYAVFTWLLIIFPNCPLFLYSHEFIRQFFFEHLHLPVDHWLGHLRIGLRRGDAFMPQHLRERLQRHAVHQADRRGIGMTCGMESDRLRKEKQR